MILFQLIFVEQLLQRLLLLRATCVAVTSRKLHMQFGRRAVTGLIRLYGVVNQSIPTGSLGGGCELEQDDCDREDDDPDEAKRQSPEMCPCD